MRQKVVNILLGIVLIGSFVALGFLFHEANLLLDSKTVSVGEAVGSTFGVIFIVVFFAIVAAIGIAGVVISLMNIKGAESKNKIFSGTFAVGYLVVFVLAVFKMIYL